MKELPFNFNFMKPIANLPTFPRILAKKIALRRHMTDREVQRRLAAILAADVASYRRLMEEDTDGTVAAWLGNKAGLDAR